MINRILVPTSCNFFFGSPSTNNSEVKRAWPGAMGDRPGSSSRVRTSEDKVRRKDLCWSVRAVYILEKLPDVSGPGLGEAGRYISDHQQAPPSFPFSRPGQRRRFSSSGSEITTMLTPHKYFAYKSTLYLSN